MNNLRNTADRLAAKRGKDEGFTLIELLVVIVILGILAAVVVFAVGGITDKGKNASCKADKKTVEVAAEAYRAQVGTYAADIPALVTAKFLRSAPETTNYTITYVVAGDSVTIGPATCPT